MSFASSYTSGSYCDNVGGKCMIPGPQQRRWISETKDCASGCTVGGNSSSTVYVSSQKNGGWTGASGAIVVFYGTNTSNQWGGGISGSYLACDTWDISAQRWLGEFLFSRSFATGGAFSTVYNSKRFDVGDSWGAFSVVEDHNYFNAELDEQKYIWGVWGGHGGVSATYGYCGIQCFKSTKPVTDITWKPSSLVKDEMWTNKDFVSNNTSAAYHKIITGRCSCHNNWYFVGFRDGTTSGDWSVYYSPDSGSNFYEGITFGKDTAQSTFSYTGFNFDYDPVSDKTLLFVKPYPITTGPGYGFYWTDCHRMSGSSTLPAPTGGFFSSKIDPNNITTTQVIANNCPTQYSGVKIPPNPETSDLESFDRYDQTRDPNWVILDPSTRKLYSIAHFSPTTDTVSTLNLIWKTIGTTDEWVSSQIINLGASVTEIAVAYLGIMSGNNHDRYMVTLLNENSDGGTYLPYLYYCPFPNVSSASNWRKEKVSLDNEGANSYRANTCLDLDDSKRFLSMFHGISSNDGTRVGACKSEAFLTYWSNNIDLYSVLYSGNATVGNTSATITGRVNNGSGNVTLYYDTSDKGELVDNWSYSKDCGTQYNNVDNGYFSTTVTGLNPNTQYYLRFYMSTLASWA